jgi:hypothetical protein
MATQNRACSGGHRHDIVEDVADLKRVALEGDHQPRRQRPRPAADIDVASDGHDWRNLPELFKKLRRACITGMNDSFGG